MPGEFDFIDWIRAQQKPTRIVTHPAGDDMAVLKWPADDLLLVGIDQVIDGVHFDSTKHSPRTIGRKVMNRNLSDYAAMACLPAAAVAAVALPRGSGIDFAKELYLGLRDAADPFYCSIIGGDTASWDGKLIVTVTILGRSGDVTPVTRAGAKAGDGIFVTGPLGGSLLGRHMTFEPRVFLAREIAKKKRATAMIDISDGLSRDLSHICRMSGVGAIIDAAKIPIHADAIKHSQQDARPPLEHALHDGEDHELLFTGPQPLPKEFIRIGEVTAEQEILLLQDGQKQPLRAKSWEHRL